MEENIYNSDNAGGSISPLPTVLRRGLTAVSLLAFLSFFSSLALFVFLTRKFILWQIGEHSRAEKRPTSPEPESPTRTDFNGFLVPDAHLCPPMEPVWEPPKETFWERFRRDPPNQFLVLIYNLLLADIQQSLAFMLNVSWLWRNALEAGTPACWAQGWFMSIGDLASTVFIAAIAVHTYLGVIKGYRLPTGPFYWAIAALWSFVYGAAILGVIITMNGHDEGGLYVRAGAWCWVNSAYQTLRLLLHYLWIFLSLSLTSAIYFIIFFHLHVHRKHSPTCCLASGSAHSPPGQHYPNPDPNNLASSSSASTKSSATSSTPAIVPPSPQSTITTDTTLSKAKRLPPIPSSARHPTFLLYPLIYILCTMPLAAGRIASMAGHRVSLAYFCFAGAMLASAGWLDVLLYSSTRRSIVFSGGNPSQDTGIDTFAFMRTPPGRRFGNLVYVSGGAGANGASGGAVRRRWANWNGNVVRGARLRTLTGGLASDIMGGVSKTGGTGAGGLGSGTAGSRNASREALGSMKGFGMGAGEVMGMAIQCETVTTVVVEEVGSEKIGSESITSTASSTRSGKM